MAESAAINSDTITITEPGGTQSPSQQRLKLKLKKPQNDKKVKWDESAVDNEFMGKKTSKCCCIYEKPRRFGDSSDDESDDDDDADCPHNAYCSGHKSNKHDTHHHHDTDHNEGSGDTAHVSDPSNP